MARVLGLVEQTLRNWVEATERSQLNPAGAKVVTPEQIGTSRRGCSQSGLDGRPDLHLGGRGLAALAVVLDLFNREIVGWSIKRADIVTDALATA